MGVNICKQNDSAIFRVVVSCGEGDIGAWIIEITKQMHWTFSWKFNEPSFCRSVSIEIHLEICDRVLFWLEVHFSTSVQKNSLKKTNALRRTNRVGGNCEQEGKKERLNWSEFRKWEDIAQICISFYIFRTTLPLLAFRLAPCFAKFSKATSRACESRRCAEKYKFQSRFHICSCHARFLVTRFDMHLVNFDENA